MNKLIVIVGPTSSKKTDLALKIAKKFSLPIINADAFQVYKELNCGTNKPSKEIIERYDIKLIHNISIYDEWNIAIFQKKAKEIIKNYHKNNKIPILVGGSNLYVDALIKNYDLSCATKRSHEYEKMTNESLYNLLLKLDKNEAKKISINNRNRLIRALQIIKSSKKQKSVKDQQKYSYAYKCLIIYPNIERKQLYESINKNVQAMLSHGWKQEVIKLLEKDKYIYKLNAFKAIGYIDIYNAIINSTDIDIDKIAKKTRHYAKRQITWCLNQYQSLFNYKKGSNDIDLLQKIEKFIND